MAAQKELSLKKLYNDLNEMRESTKEKVDYIYNLFVNESVFPVDITTEEDGPGLWPLNGIMMYSIIPSQNISEMFCTRGTLFHFACGNMSFQIMNVVDDIVDTSKIGKIYVRTGDIENNTWGIWELLNTSKNTFQSLVYKGYLKTKAKNIVPNVNPRTTYMEVAMSIASTYSLLIRQEVLKGTSRINDLVTNLLSTRRDFPNNLLELKEGQLIIYGNNEYIAVYDGAGGCYGSSLRLGDVVHFEDCLNVDDQLMPTKILAI